MQIQNSSRKQMPKSTRNRVSGSNFENASVHLCFLHELSMSFTNVFAYVVQISLDLHKL